MYHKSPINVENDFQNKVERRVQTIFEYFPIRYSYSLISDKFVLLIYSKIAQVSQILKLFKYSISLK